jgi:hypothetical protein
MGQGEHAVGPDVQSGAAVTQLRGAFEDDAVDALLLQGQRGGDAADPAAGDENTA